MFLLLTKPSYYKSESLKTTPGIVAQMKFSMHDQAAVPNSRKFLGALTFTKEKSPPPTIYVITILRNVALVYTHCSVIVESGIHQESKYLQIPPIRLSSLELLKKDCNKKIIKTINIHVVICIS